MEVQIKKQTAPDQRQWWKTGWQADEYRINVDSVSLVVVLWMGLSTLVKNITSWAPE